MPNCTLGWCTLLRDISLNIFNIFNMVVSVIEFLRTSNTQQDNGDPYQSII